MNLQLFIGFFSVIHDNVNLYAENIYFNMDSGQKKYFMNALKCTGFKDGSCGRVVSELYVVMRNAVMKSVVFMVLVESMGIAILLILKMKNKRNHKRGR